MECSPQKRRKVSHCMRASSVPIVMMAQAPDKPERERDQRPFADSPTDQAAIDQRPQRQSRKRESGYVRARSDSANT